MFVTLAAGLLEGFPLYENTLYDTGIPMESNIVMVASYLTFLILSTCLSYLISALILSLTLSMAVA